MRTIFSSLARANERARVQNVRDFCQTKLDSEINARFLLNEHGDPHFLFYKFNEDNILNNWKKNWGSPCSFKRKQAFISLSSSVWGKSLTSCTRARSFANRAQKECAVQNYWGNHLKCMNGLAPGYLSDQFVKRSSITTCKTRNSQLLHIPLFKLALLGPLRLYI